MKKVNRIVKTVAIFIVGASLALGNPLYVSADDNLKTAVLCSFVVPKEFVPGDKKGLFIHELNPMESATIYYSVYDTGKDKVLTNREKKELENSGQKIVIEEYEKLTQDIYQKMVSDEYNKEYGSDVGYTVSSFNKITIDGYPGYKIDASYKASGEEKIYQTVYMILSKYRVFTLTYQRAEDDECQDKFDESAKTIHVI